MTNEIAFKNRETALEVAKILLDEDYVVMLSSEEDLTILNYEWAEYGDRNGVVFISLDQYDKELTEMCKNCGEERMCDGCKG